MTVSSTGLPSDRSLSFISANVFGLAAMVAIVGIALPLHAALWGLSGFDMFEAMFDHSISAMVVVATISIVGHEMLHGIGFRLAGAVPWSAIRFGINWCCLAPYASVRQPVTARTYRCSAALPAIALGVAPILLGLASGSAVLTAYGALMLSAAGGDLAALWVLRGVPGSAIVLDSERRVGCVVIQLDQFAPTSWNGAQ